MGLKRRNKAEAGFNMSSMTDIVFLLLIFFMLTSTVVRPSAIKLTLPQSQSQTSVAPLTRVVIDKDLNHFVAFGNEKDRPIALEEIEAYLKSVELAEPEMKVVLYADETVPHGEVVKILNIANQNKFKLVIATRPMK
ncbi:MAG: biopolymer transporter ExbD [Paludibacteraceae bacterium]|nr:biopolymer transporter ExbD [Paludibacteraceae bacterium]